MVEAFDSGFENGELGNASSWKWLASTLVMNIITAAHNTTSQVFQRKAIKTCTGPAPVLSKSIDEHYPT